MHMRLPMAVSTWLCCLSALVAASAAEGGLWRQQATVLPTGDLELRQEPYRYLPGEEIRYIDYESGADSNPGTRAAPWKHHPWDADFSGQADDAVDTYVFKRGVVYRGALTGTRQGSPGRPIRLLSDPEWGAGHAALWGSEPASGWQRVASGSAPAGMPAPERVWYVQLDGSYTPYAVFQVRDGEPELLPLARMPNWSVSDEHDVKSEWWQWEEGNRRGGKFFTGIDTTHLTEDRDFYEDALVYSEWGIVMSTPVPLPIKKFDPKKRELTWEGFFTPNWAGPTYTGMRYYLADKPHYLDAAGEWWYDDEQQRLYFRPPQGVDPNQLQIEIGRHGKIIDLKQPAHLRFAGLAFRCSNDVELGLEGFDIYEERNEFAAIRLWGSVQDVHVRHCDFRQVAGGVIVDVDTADVTQAPHGEDISVSDSRFDHIFQAAIAIRNELGGKAQREGLQQSDIYNVRVLRNHITQSGFRPSRGSHGHCIVSGFANTLEVAGNILDRIYGSGIFVFGGKGSGNPLERPFSRILIHHNKVTDSLLNTNDWGGIETWQGGPYYVFNNISGNPGGYRHWRWLRQKDADFDRIGHVGTRFGHAYYLDGAFKNYYFNNIAWGLEKDLRSPLMNTAAFQEIHSYQNQFINNTAYMFGAGTRRQSPRAGRNLYLGNIFSEISDVVFIHAKGDDRAPDVNAADAGDQGSDFAYETIGYAGNVLHGIDRNLGVIEETGNWRNTVDELSAALESVGALAYGVGVLSQEQPLRDPAGRDFRPRPDSAAIDHGAQVFVPWSLYGTVGEWHFHRNNQDPGTVIDEHWYMTPLHVDRATYHDIPTWPLRGEGITADDYRRGELEDWTDSVLTLDGQQDVLVCDLPDGSEAAAYRAQAEAMTMVAPQEWISLKRPEAILPGLPFQIEITIDESAQQAGSHLVAELMCRKHKGWGGLVARSDEGPQAIDGAGPYTFSFMPKSKGGLKEYVLVIWVGPDGNYKQRSEAHTEKNTVPALDAVHGATPDQFRTPDIATEDLIVESHLRLQPGASGVLVHKLADQGYQLRVAEDGSLVLRLVHADGSAELSSSGSIADGTWHHILVEADRADGQLRIYIDGQEDASGAGIDDSVDLSNLQDLYVGGTPDGEHLAVELDFLRIARGSLQRSRTTIEELYAWQFDGPVLRDFAGHEPTGVRRDAGALELRP